jgi:hypothetical protein
MKPCQAHHPDHVKGCRLCWLARHDARYRERWGIEGPPEPVPPGSGFKPSPRPPATPPCVHLGDRLTGAVREAAGLSHVRDWRTCAKGHGEPAGVVCGCVPFPRGCRGCPDYEGDAGD